MRLLALICAVYLMSGCERHKHYEDDLNTITRKVHEDGHLYVHKLQIYHIEVGCPACPQED